MIEYRVKLTRPQMAMIEHWIGDKLLQVSHPSNKYYLELQEAFKAARHKEIKRRLKKRENGS